LNIFQCGSTWPKLIKAHFCKMPELKLNLLQRFRWETDVLLLLLWTRVPPTAILDRTCPVKFVLISWSTRCTTRCPNYKLQDLMQLENQEYCLASWCSVIQLHILSGTKLSFGGQFDRLFPLHSWFQLF
jgi:hypothetical protein